MQSFTASIYVPLRVALAMRIPVWGRLRVEIPLERVMTLDNETVVGLGAMYWNQINPDAAKIEQAGIMESEFKDIDPRCAWTIDEVSDEKPFPRELLAVLRDTTKLKRVSVDDCAWIVTPDAAIVVLEYILARSREYGASMTALAQQSQGVMSSGNLGPERDTPRLRARLAAAQAAAQEAIQEQLPRVAADAVPRGTVFVVEHGAADAVPVPIDAAPKLAPELVQSVLKNSDEIDEEDAERPGINPEAF